MRIFIVYLLGAIGLMLWDDYTTENLDESVAVPALLLTIAVSYLVTERPCV